MPICRVDGRENIIVVEQKVRVPDDLAMRGMMDQPLRVFSRARLRSPQAVFSPYA